MNLTKLEAYENVYYTDAYIHCQIASAPHDIWKSFIGFLKLCFDTAFILMILSASLLMY